MKSMSVKKILSHSPLYGSLSRRVWTKVKGYMGNVGARHDDLAFRIMRRVIQQDSNCLDIGCHNGLYLDQVISLAPYGMHHAFEPIPGLSAFLRTRYRQYHNVYIHELALSNALGTTTFHFNKTHPGWSGIKRREYPSQNDAVQVLSIDTQRLDDVLPQAMRVDFLKLDVEGAELAVLEGAQRTIQRNKPLMIFEYGLGSAEYYEAWPERMFDLLAESGLLVSPIETVLHSPEPMTRSAFINYFHSHAGYYFVAYSHVHQAALC